MKDKSKNSLAVLIALLTVYIVWGSTYLAIRIGLDGWPPFMLGATRFIVAGIILWFLGWRRKESFPKKWVELRTAIIAGFLMLTLGNGMVVWSEQYVTSGMTAVIIATVSLWMMGLESLRPGGEPMSWAKFFGAVIGLAGVATLMADELFNGRDANVFIGQLALLGASFAWAAGSIYSKHAPMPKSTLMGSSVQMLAGGFALLILAGYNGEYTEFDASAALSGRSLWALIYLTIFGSCIAFTAYTWLLRHSSPALASTYAYVNPVVAVFLGAIILDEPVTMKLILGSALVLLSVFVIQRARMRLAARLKHAALPSQPVVEVENER